MKYLKRIPLRIYFMIIIALIALALTIFLARRLWINHSFVSAYNNGEYNTEEEAKLTKNNFPESYVPYYNLGNAAYKNGDYNTAIGYYQEAMKMYPPRDKDISIRINQALAMCNTIDFNDLNTQEKIDTALFILYKARDLLTEKGYATEAGTEETVDPTAQQLKEDIDRLIEQLENPQQSQQNNNDQEQNQSGDNDNGSSGNSSGSSDKEKRIQGELEGNKKDALEDRKETQDNMEKWGNFNKQEEGSSDGGDLEGESGGGDSDGSGGSGSGITNPW